MWRVKANHAHFADVKPNTSKTWTSAACELPCFDWITGNAMTLCKDDYWKKWLETTEKQGACRKGTAFWLHII